MAIKQVWKMNFDDHCQIPDLVHISNKIVFDEEERFMISSSENLLPQSVFLTKDTRIGLFLLMSKMMSMIETL